MNNTQLSITPKTVMQLLVQVPIDYLYSPILYHTLLFFIILFVYYLLFFIVRSL